MTEELKVDARCAIKILKCLQCRGFDRDLRDLLIRLVQEHDEDFLLVNPRAVRAIIASPAAGRGSVTLVVKLVLGGELSPFAYVSAQELVERLIQEGLVSSEEVRKICSEDEQQS